MSEEKKAMAKPVPQALIPHLRQFMHNDGSRLVFGYDMEGVDRTLAIEVGRWKDAYLNIRAWAEQNGLDTKTYNVDGSGIPQPAPVEMPPPDADDYVSIELCDMYTHIGIDGKWYTFAELQAALAQPTKNGIDTNSTFDDWCKEKGLEPNKCDETNFWIREAFIGGLAQCAGSKAKVHYKDNVHDNGETWREAARQTREQLAQARSILTTNQPQPVAAWITVDGERVVTAKTMEGAKRDGGAMLSSMRPYSVALYAATTPQPDSERDAALKDEQIESLREIGQSWMSESGRDALEDWIAAIAAQQGEKGETK